MTDSPNDLAPLTRCWPDVDANPQMIAYHDDEWGTPLHDDHKLFEFLVLEGFQAGLSWRTILNKRPAFRNAFDGFDVEKVADYGDEEVARLLEDKGIVRNRQKILATINNAQRFIEAQKDFGSFDRYIWQFTNYKTLRSPNPIRSWEDVPATSPESDAMSKDLKARGFKFVGSTICYAHMQATGMVNDHHENCYKATLGDW